MRRFSPLLCLLTACSATKGLSDLADGVDCALGCGLANAVGLCGQSGCEIASCTDGFADCNGLPDDGCEVDTDADPTNCAFCGNVCDTGACHQGSCQDVNVVASPPGDGRGIVDFVVDPSGVYFVLAPGLAALPEAGAPAAVSLDFVAQAGGEPVSLAELTGSAGTLVEGEERICLLLRESSGIASPYSLLSLPKTGGERTLVSRVEELAAAPMVLEPYVYWLTGGLTAVGTLDSDGGVPPATDQALHRALIAGGTDETLASWTKPDFVSLLAAGSGVLLLAKGTLLEYDGGLLGVTSNGLFSFDPASRAEVEISKGIPRPHQAVLKDGIVYWIIMGVNAGSVATTPSSLEFVPLSGGAPTTLWTSNEAIVAEEVAVTDRHFFLTVALSRAGLLGQHSQSQAYFYGILRLDRANGQESLVAKRDSPPHHLVADGEYVYWLEGGQILRALQAGTPS
jgi:hypothetical protein